MFVVRGSFPELSKFEFALVIRGPSDLVGGSGVLFGAKSDFEGCWHRQMIHIGASMHA